MPTVHTISKSQYKELEAIVLLEQSLRMDTTHHDQHDQQQQQQLLMPSLSSTLTLKRQRKSNDDIDQFTSRELNDEIHYVRERLEQLTSLQNNQLNDSTISTERRVATILNDHMHIHALDQIEQMTHQLQRYDDRVLIRISTTAYFCGHMYDGELNSSIIPNNTLYSIKLERSHLGRMDIAGFYRSILSIRQVRFQVISSADECAVWTDESPMLVYVMIDKSVVYTLDFGNFNEHDWIAVYTQIQILTVDATSFGEALEESVAFFDMLISEGYNTNISVSEVSFRVKYIPEVVIEQAKVKGWDLDECKRIYDEDCRGRLFRAGIESLIKSPNTPPW